MTTLRHTTIPANHAVSVGSPFLLLTQAISGWATNSRNRRDYEQLLRKTDAELEDIGIDRAWLQKEVKKGFWKA